MGFFAISAAAPQSLGVTFLFRPTAGDAPFLGIRLDRIDSFFSLAFEEATETCRSRGAVANAYPTRRLLQQAHHDAFRSFLITDS